MPEHATKLESNEHEHRHAPICPAETGARRDRFTTGLGVLAATLGSAVGLGNIWKFPFLAGENGGAAFLVIYIASTLLVGLPVMISELLLGRQAKADAITTLRVLAPRHQPWWLVGAAGALSAFLILAFYTVVAGWVFAYIGKALSGGLLSTDPAVTGAAFAELVASPLASLAWQWVVLLLVGSIIVCGVARGIEKTTRKLMPILFVILVIIGLRSLTLPGAGAGLAFLFHPDFSKVTGTTILVAMGLSFFKLSTGMGTMITYGSYFGDEQDIPKTALRVMFADLAVSLLAGIAIFPAVFAFGFKPDAGPALLFITIPAVFANLPFGNLFMILFFILAAVAATGAMLSLLEVPVAYLHQGLCLSRLKATTIVVLLLALIGATAALSNNLLAGVTFFGKNFFDLYDFLTSNLLLPLGGLLICVFTAWIYGDGRIREALSNRGTLSNAGLIRVFSLIVRYLSPVLVLLILLKGLGFL